MAKYRCNILKVSLSFVVGLGIWVASCHMVMQSAIAAPTETDIVHVINRLSFGPSPGDIQHVQSIGIDAYIQEQLHPETTQDSPELLRQLEQYQTLALPPMQLVRQYKYRGSGKGKPKLSPEKQKKLRRRVRIPLEEASDARLARAIASSHQLEEVMVDFWFNHFNVSASKGLTKFWVGSYEQQAIRPYVFGSFRDLLEATAKHPAMLYYLDNWQNTAPHSTTAPGRFKGLNENYARELLELHTMGVKGGYSQADVITAAKILTGWGLPQGRQRTTAKQGFYFDARRHDNSRKTFLGQSITGQGVAEGEQLLDMLANHPATAQHISYKLAQYFVTDAPPAPLVDRLAQQFQATNGDIRAVLATLFQSSEFRDTQFYQQKFKTPYEYIISVARAVDSPRNKTRFISGTLNQFDMPLYQCQTPNGYANIKTSWLNPDATLRRISLATAFVQRQGRRHPAAQSTQLQQTLGHQFSAQTQSVIDNSPQRLRAALILGSPEMMYR